MGETSISLGRLAAAHGCELHGDPERRVARIATLESADAECISFLSNRSYLAQLRKTQAAAVILLPGDVAACPTAALATPDPYGVYTEIARTLHPEPVLTPGVHAGAHVSADCDIPESCELQAGCVIQADVKLGERVLIGANAVIERGAVIGSDTRILANAVICHGARLGERCLIHPGAIIGSDGFGNARAADGSWTKIPQVGGIQIGDDVEIGACTTVDRGAIDDTVIGAGGRIDNLVQIGHNVKVGAHTAIAATVGIAGSAIIGARCMVGGAAGIAGHIEISDDVVIGPGTAVVKSISKPGVYGGPTTLAQDIGKWRRNTIRALELDEMAKRIRSLEKQLEKLTPDD